MKNYTDKELAVFMLEMRQHNGRAPWRYFKKNGWRMVFLIGFIILLLGLGIFAQSWWICGFGFGFVAGIFSRDRDGVRQQQAVWPFYTKIIDWGTVETIAKGESSA